MMTQDQIFQVVNKPLYNLTGLNGFSSTSSFLLKSIIEMMADKVSYRTISGVLYDLILADMKLAAPNKYELAPLCERIAEDLMTEFSLFTEFK